METIKKLKATSSAIELRSVGHELYGQLGPGGRFLLLYWALDCAQRYASEEGDEAGWEAIQKERYRVCHTGADFYEGEWPQGEALRAAIEMRTGLAAVGTVERLCAAGLAPA